MKNNFYRFSLMLLVLFSAIACKNKTEKTEQDTIQTATKELNVSGNYVTEDYSKRNEGYDWVSVRVDELKNNQLKISIRSRADKKKPTCTFDTKAFKKNENSYESTYDGKIIKFEFSEENITISTENPDDSNMLYFFCNGGVSLAGTYEKINEELDQQQIDLTKFMKVLYLQDVGFNISSIEKGSKNTMSIFTFGLEESEYSESFDIEGEQVIDAEVEDLNSDGSPELFVYTQTIGSGSYGNVYAFSVNNNKSMSQVYFQQTAENDKINKGYMGHDEFSIVENSLVQRFPIYKEKDTNGNTTGGTRQVSYKLIDGEASRKLVVNKVSEY
jgi:hypothetical protein